MKHKKNKRERKFDCMNNGHAIEKDSGKNNSNKSHKRNKSSKNKNKKYEKNISTDYKSLRKKGKAQFNSSNNFSDMDNAANENLTNKTKKILEFMNDDQYVSMKAKDIATLMSVPKNEYSEFLNVINLLKRQYRISENRKGMLSLIDSNRYVVGVIRVNERGFGFVKVDKENQINQPNNDEKKEAKSNKKNDFKGNEIEEIYIAGRNRNQALNGDKVVVELYDNNNCDKYEKDKFSEHKEGKVVAIIEHGKNRVVGLYEKSRNFGFVVPDDKRFGTDIFISKNNTLNAQNRQKVIVEITKYPTRERKAEGKIIEIIGDIDAAGVDMLSLIKEYDLPNEFPEDVIEEAQNCTIIEEIDYKNRADFRDLDIFTVDGEDAKDLDDAVYVSKTQDGNYKLIVSIADVSHYVKEGSCLDKEAITRGTSVYMMDRVIPMLPKELSNGICSLNAHEDRLSLSVVMEIDKSGNVISSDIKKSIINVKERMSYTGVYKIYRKLNKMDITDEELESIEKYAKYEDEFSTMFELATILKNKRLISGSLDLDVPESKIILDSNGVAIDVKKYEINFANEVIEQFMLIANEVVAEKFFWLEAPFIYRVHEVPDIDKIDELNKFLMSIGYRIKYNKDNIHPKAFADILTEIKGKPEERVVSNMILRSLKLAKYESENKGHFGLASKYYCHFTSPIRRYPDLYIHRIISMYINNGYNIPDENLEKYFEQSVSYSEQSSERERVAQKVERDSEDIKKAEFMMSKVGEEYDGIISSVTSFGMFVELENTVEGLVRFENMGNEYFIYDEERKELIGEQTGKKYKIGDKVRIRVLKASKELRQIDFGIITNEINA